MKYEFYLKYTFAICIASIMIECNNNPSLNSRKENLMLQNKFAGIKFAVNKDVACGMPLEDIEDTANYQGKVYGFCSEECKKKFKQNPEACLATQHSETSN